MARYYLLYGDEFEGAGVECGIIRTRANDMNFREGKLVRSSLL